MFESLSLFALQQYWWAIISLLGALLVFMLFVQGGQTLLYTLGKTENEVKMLVNSLGRKWDITFTTLVTFGGAPVLVELTGSGLLFSLHLFYRLFRMNTDLKQIISWEPKPTMFFSLLTD